MKDFKGKIMIADDEPFNVDLTTIHLTWMWVKRENIIVATDWIEAVQKAMTNNIALIFMDVIMPGGGWIKAAETIKSHYKEKSPIIIAKTAYAHPIEWIAVMDHVIITPINKDNFEKILKDVLNRQS